MKLPISVVMKIIYSYNGALCLLSLRSDGDNSSVWTNPKPGGDEYMRPYLMSYETETEEMVGNGHRSI